MEPTTVNGRDLSRYQGKRLLFLLAAMFVPAAFLYLSVILSLAAGRSSETARQQIWMLRLALLALAIFVPAQVVSARYIQTILKPRSSRAGKLAQYFAVLAMSLLISFIAVLVLEAAGFNLLIAK